MDEIVRRVGRRLDAVLPYDTTASRQVPLLCAGTLSLPLFYLCPCREEIRQLFMKIDADAGGTVDW